MDNWDNIFCNNFIYKTKEINDKKELKIEKSCKKNIQLRSLDNMMFEEETQKTYYCRTIKAFTKRFPNIAKIQKFIEIH